MFILNVCPPFFFVLRKALVSTTIYAHSKYGPIGTICEGLMSSCV